MLNRSKLLLVVVGFCLNAAASGDVDCSKQPKYVNPKTCCPMPDLITAELKEKCKSFDVTPRPRPTDASGSSVESKRRHHHHHPPACVMECFFNETGIYENRRLDETKLESYINVVYADSTDLKNVATQAFVTCAEKLADRQAKIKAKVSGPHPSPPPGTNICSFAASHLMGCVFNNLMKNCPDSIKNNDQECTDMREFFTNCKPQPGGPPISSEKP
ncbi:general odorant-binding protein 67 [Drosophila obscura]|uniref:general odorant-binding protein 67 n=1 Tax=Drosophila obscura TaxID=7282 RepID=UPI001BB2C13C|nr:general odorant-binding protein 67 [Drosophila obscura]